MAVSTLKNIYGPLWPLGLIVVATKGTPVSIMSLVDATSANAPETASTAAGLQTTTTGMYEYASCAAYDILLTPMKSVNPVVANTGAIYVVMYPLRTAGTGNNADPGVLVMTIPPFTAGTLTPVHLSSTVGRLSSHFNPYNLYLDSDNNSDGAIVTLLI